MSVHGVASKAMVQDHEPVRVTWHVIDCKCGWNSPLCESPEKARRLYDRHRRAKVAA